MPKSGRVFRLPQGIYAHNVHEFGIIKLSKQRGLARDAGIGKEDVEAVVLGQRVVDDGLDLFLIAGVELAGVHLDRGESGIDLLFMRLEVRVVKVADVDCLCAALGILVGGGSADAQR